MARMMCILASVFGIAVVPAEAPTPTPPERAQAPTVVADGAPTPPPPERAQAPTVVADEVLVAFVPSLPIAARERVLVEHGAIGARYSERANAAVALTRPGGADALVAALSGHPAVREARPNAVVSAATPCDEGGGCGSAGRPLVGGQWTEGFEPPDSALYEVQWQHHRQYAWLAWDGGAQRGAGVKVAVLDTGVTPVSTLTHVAVEEGANFVEPGGTPYDDNGHGTHMASIIASSGALWGVAPDAVIVPIKVLDADKVGSEAALIEGLWHAASIPDLKVVSMSLTFPIGYRPSVLLTEAVDALSAAGVIMVGAAGNDGLDAVGYPAHFPQVIAVGAARLQRRSDGTVRPVVAEYSNRGYALDLVAYGGDLSRDEDMDGFPDGVLGESLPTAAAPSGLFVTVGTSPAAASVAGASALLIGAGVPADEVRNRLQATASRLDTVELHPDWGQGLLHIGAAMPGVTEWYQAPAAERHLLANPQLVFERVGTALEAVAVVEVLDEEGEPAVDHQVAVQFSGDVLENAAGYTDDKGVVVLRSTPLPADAEGIVAVSVESVMIPETWEPVRPTPASRVDRLSYELLSTLGTGLVSSAIVWSYGKDTWANSPYVDQTRLVDSYTVRAMGRGGSGAVVVAMRPDYYLGHGVDAHSIHFVTNGTGLVSSAIIVDENLFNPDRRAELGAESLLVEHVGPAADGSRAVRDGGARDSLDAFFVGEDPAVLVTTRGTGLVSSAIVWNSALWNPELFQGPELGGWEGRGAGVSGTASAMFLLTYGQPAVEDCGGSWEVVDALYPNKTATPAAKLADNALPTYFQRDDATMVVRTTPPATTPEIIASPIGCDGVDGAGVANECGGCGPVPEGGCGAPVVNVPDCVGAACDVSTIDDGGAASGGGCGAASSGAGGAMALSLLALWVVALRRRREE